MVASAACRETIARFGAGFAAYCVLGVTAVPAAAQLVGPPAPPKADAAIAKAQELVDPIKRCPRPKPGEIVVCSTGEDPARLTPEERAIAREGREAPPKLPRAEAKAMSLDKLPYNWISLGGRPKPGPEYNPLYEKVKRETDPETGTPPVPEEPDP